MEIRISRGYTFPECEPYIRVDMYKTHEAYLYPERHEGDIWNTCCTFDTNDPSQPNDLHVVDRLLSIIETSVNTLLDAVKDKK